VIALENQAMMFCLAWKAHKKPVSLPMQQSLSNLCTLSASQELPRSGESFVRCLKGCLDLGTPTKLLISITWTKNRCHRQQNEKKAQSYKWPDWPMAQHWLFNDQVMKHACRALQKYMHELGIMPRATFRTESFQLSRSHSFKNCPL
jgi:hypothetical protein